MNLTKEQISALGLVFDKSVVESHLETCVRLDERSELFAVVGAASVKIALEYGYEPHVVLVRDDDLFLSDIEDVRNIQPALPICILSEDEMRRIVGINILRGFVGLFRRKPLPEASELLEGARFALVVEGEILPLEIGSLIRSAAALWVDAVLLASVGTDPYDAAVVRGSTGNLCRLPVGAMDEPCNLDEVLQDAGFRVLRLASQGGPGVSDIEAIECGESDRVALVFNATDYAAGYLEAREGSTHVCVASDREGDLKESSALSIALWVLAGKMKLIS